MNKILLLKCVLWSVYVNNNYCPAYHYSYLINILLYNVSLSECRMGIAVSVKGIPNGIKMFTQPTR